MSSSSRPKSRERRRSASSTQGSGLLVTVRFNNRLPEPPFPPKFLSYGFDPQRLTEYSTTSLEKNHKHKVLAPVDVGVAVDLTDDSLFAADARRPVLDPKDEALLRDVLTESTEDKRTRQLEKSIPWLLKPEYISTESRAFGRAATVAEHSLVVGSLPEMDNSREAKVAAVEKTFAAAAQTPRHPSKPHLKPMAIYPILPDFDRWKMRFFKAVFDADPSPVNPTVEPGEGREQLSQGLIVGSTTAEGEPEAHYYLPTRDTMLQRKRRREEGDDIAEGDSYSFYKVREYNWQNEDATAPQEEEFIFSVRPSDGVVAFSDLNTIRLSKKRGKRQTRKVVTIRHRPPTAEEEALGDARLDMLEPESTLLDETQMDAAGWGVEGQDGGGSDGGGPDGDEGRMDPDVSPPLQDGLADDALDGDKVEE